METISCKRAATVPTECHKIGARSGKLSLFFDNSSKTTSLFIVFESMGSCLGQI